MFDEVRAKKVLEFLRTATEKELENWADYFSVNIGDPDDPDNGLDDAVIESRDKNGFTVTGIHFADWVDHELCYELFVSWSGELTVVSGSKEFSSKWKFLGDFAY